MTAGQAIPTARSKPTEVPMETIAMIRKKPI
jgi:hypothetical protein